METYIVVVGVQVTNSRRICERLENKVFNTLVEAQDYIKDNYPDDRNLINLVGMSDFMDTCNNQELNLEEYFIGYIKVGGDFKI